MTALSSFIYYSPRYYSDGLSVYVENMFPSSHWRITSFQFLIEDHNLSKCHKTSKIDNDVCQRSGKSNKAHKRLVYSENVHCAFVYCPVLSCMTVCMYVCMYVCVMVWSGQRTRHRQRSQ